MRIFLDAMGGDNAPHAPVAGALEALRTVRDATRGLPMLVFVGLPVAVENDVNAAAMGESGRH